MVSIGGGGIVVFALSSWLGKVWAGRILSKEANALSLKLAEAQSALDLVKQAHLRFQDDKVQAYREIIEVIGKLLATMDAEGGWIMQWDTSTGAIYEFNVQRRKLYGYLVMVAPQSVIDAQDELVDLLLRTSSGEIRNQETEIREKLLSLLNAIREDIGLAPGRINFNIHG